ncbi:MAG: nuclear transport factor 2 family protein [Gemmatimonadaceae bacterium]
MRSLAVLLALSAFGSLAAQQGSAVSKELIAKEDGWAAALVKRDTSYFRRTLATGFVYTEDAKLMSRDEVLRSAVTPADTVVAAHNEDMVVHQAGAVTAVVTGILVMQGRESGKPYLHRYRFTDTWVKQAGGQWQIVAAQDYLMAAK